MVYEAFLRSVKEAVQGRLGQDYKVTVLPVLKNNDLSLDGLCVTREGDCVSPTVYLNPFYDRLSDGTSLDQLVDELEKLYRDSRALCHDDVEKIAEFGHVRDRIAYKLINAGSNQRLLSQVPHRLILDLAVVFYVIVDQSSQGQLTALIHSDHLKLWDIDEEQLYHLAAVNTPRLLPPKMDSMLQLLKTIAQNNLGEYYSEEYIDKLLSAREIQSPLHALSNTNGVLGACSMIYPGLLKDFAEKEGTDLIILPSSVHEVLLLPCEEDMDYCQLDEMVSTINQMEVPCEDRLSNHVYLYDRSTDSLSIPPSFSGSDGTGNPPQIWPLR